MCKVQTFTYYVNIQFIIWDDKISKEDVIRREKSKKAPRGLKMKIKKVEKLGSNPSQMWEALASLLTFQTIQLRPICGYFTRLY